MVFVLLEYKEKGEMDVMDMDKKRIKELLEAIEESHEKLIDVSPDKEVRGKELEYLKEYGYINGAIVLRGGIGNKVISTQTDNVQILKYI